MDRGLHLSPEGPDYVIGSFSLIDGPRKPVEHIAARRGQDGFAQHVHHDAVRDQVTVVNIGFYLQPQWRPVLDVLT